MLTCHEAEVEFLYVKSETELDVVWALSEPNSNGLEEICYITHTTTPNFIRVQIGFWFLGIN